MRFKTIGWLNDGTPVTWDSPDYTISLTPTSIIGPRYYVTRRREGSHFASTSSLPSAKQAAKDDAAQRAARK